MFKIDNYYDLLAIHRALMEVKFSKSIQDASLVYSPIISKISIMIVNEIITTLEKEGKLDDANKWKNWMILDESRQEWDCIVNNIYSILSWNRMTDKDKEDCIVLLASPLSLNSDKIKRLLSINLEISTHNQNQQIS
jgi:hypothetical protein